MPELQAAAEKLQLEVERLTAEAAEVPISELQDANTQSVELTCLSSTVALPASEGFSTVIWGRLVHPLVPSVHKTCMQARRTGHDKGLSIVSRVVLGLCSALLYSCSYHSHVSAKN